MKALKFREVEQMIEAAGLQVISMERNGHIKARVRRASDGRESLQVFPSTPSDYRGLKNRVASLRRFAKGEV